MVETNWIAKNDKSKLHAYKNNTKHYLKVVSNFHCQFLEYKEIITKLLF